MKEKLIRFMQGRYGADQFSRFLLFAGLGAMLLAMLFGRNEFFGSVLMIAGWAAVIYTYIRMFSKNHAKRYAENQTYLQRRERVRYLFKNRKNIAGDRKNNHIYRCPSCGQKIRIPKGKGKIEITCPKCSTRFVKRS